MAIFRKNRINEYEQASRDLNNIGKGKIASDLIIFEKLEDDDNRAVYLIDRLKAGNPLVISFQDLDEMAANKMLAFISGACYALDGKIVKLKEYSYLFAKNSDFLDGSLKEFIDSV